MKKYRYTVAGRVMLGDLHTPVGTYLKVRDIFPQSALMESCDYHGSEDNRSFIGFRPVANVAVRHGAAQFEFPDGSREEHPLNDDYTVARAMDDFIGRFEVSGEFARYVGLYGYTSFNIVRHLERVPVRDSSAGRNDAPDLLYIVYRYLIVFHDRNHEMLLLEMLGEGEESNLDDVERRIGNHNYPDYGFRAEGECRSTLSDEEHLANIDRGIAHCLRGDVFQIVLSRRFVQPYSGDDFKLYRALRSINPSPYLFYFDFGGFRIFGASPETHCRIEGGRAYIDPIAGTAPRGSDRRQDAEAAARLRADPKENAEHVMLVDLARNDLSRHCDDVEVEFYKDVQYYSHVIHLVSRVRGTIRPDSSPVETFFETFPAGTLSGAPKVRAMQLIGEYEPHNRGAYGGCIGFIGMDGSLNQAITIRTFVSRDNELWFQAGGGIVARSDRQAELQEVNNKLAALRRAVAAAERI